MTNILYIINILVAGLSIFFGTAVVFYLIYASDLPNWVKFSFGVTFVIVTAGVFFLICASDLPIWAKGLFGFVVGVFYGVFLMLLTDDITDYLKRRRDRKDG